MITPEKIFQFLQGNIRMIFDDFDLLEHHIKEQVIYRAKICGDDCVQWGRCKYCSCDVPGKFYVDKSCNGGERFPDLMSKEDWETFKKEKDIQITF